MDNDGGTWETVLVRRRRGAMKTVMDKDGCFLERQGSICICVCVCICICGGICVCVCISISEEVKWSREGGVTVLQLRGLFLGGSPRARGGDGPGLKGLAGGGGC